MIESPTQEAEVNLLSNLLKREQKRATGARTFSMDEIKEIAENTLRTEK